MKKITLDFRTLVSWFLGFMIFSLGILNLILIHPVPGGILIFLALIYFPPVEGLFQKKLGFSIPFFLLVVLALVIFWFTLGVSDLGEMYGF